MKFPMDILRLSAGRIEDGGMLYANAIVLDETVADQITDDRIDVGQQHAKIKIDTSDNNKIARDLAVSGLIPGTVTFHVKNMVKKGEMSMIITGFDGK